MSPLAPGARVQVTITVTRTYEVTPGLAMDGCYQVQQHLATGEFYWVFREPGEDPDVGDSTSTISAALRAAAQDWECTGGSIGTLTGRLRRAAAMYERSGR